HAAAKALYELAGLVEFHDRIELRFRAGARVFAAVEGPQALAVAIDVDPDHRAEFSPVRQFRPAVIELVEIGRLVGAVGLLRIAARPRYRQRRDHGGADHIVQSASPHRVILRCVLAQAESRNGDIPLNSTGRPRGQALRSQSAEIAEFLHALSLHLGGVDVALAVDADEVEIVELAELMADAADAVDDLAGRAIDDMELAVRVVDHQQIGLLRVRPLHDRADRAGVALLEH